MATQKQVQKTAEKVVSPEMPRQRNVRKELLEVSKDIESGYVKMSELLSEAYHRDYHTTWGFDSFEDYADKELDVDYRKARYLIDIWDKIKDLALPKARIAKLGWTKMKEIAAVITKKNAMKLLDQAEKMTSRELVESVKIMKKTGGRESIPQAPSVLKLTITMGESEHQIVMEALDAAKKLCNSDNQALALEMICQDWLSEKGAKPTATHLEDHIKYLEKSFPVKISFKVVPEKTKKAKEERAEKEKIIEEVEKKVKKGKKSAPDEDALPEEAGDGNIDDLLA